MTHRTRNHARLLIALTLGAAVSVTGIGTATAAEATVDLGTVGSYAVLAASTVTNTGPTTISGDLGVSPGTAITGFPPGTVSDGTTHANDAHAAGAQAALTTAYNDAASRSSTGAIAADLGGTTLVGGVYTGGAVTLTGTLTLDGGGDPDSVFIFQASSTLTTASASRVRLVGDARACNVFWQVGSSATLGTSSDFVGTILAQTSVTANTGATVEGRLLARTGAVTLDDNDVEQTTCAAAGSTTTSSTTTSSTTTTTPTTSTTGSPAATSSTTTPTTAPSTVTTVGGPDAGDPAGTGGATVAPVAPGSPDAAATSTGDAAPATLPRTGMSLGALSALAALSILAGAALVHTGQRRLVPPVVRLRRLAR